MDETPLENKELKAPVLAADAVPDAVTYPVHSLEESAPAVVDATENAPESPAEPAEVLCDCGHPGPGFTAASGTETVVHCGKCAGMTGY